jgi:hypothetical protein
MPPAPLDLLIKTTFEKTADTQNRGFTGYPLHDKAVAMFR